MRVNSSAIAPPCSGEDQRDVARFKLVVCPFGPVHWASELAVFDWTVTTVVTRKNTQTNPCSLAVYRSEPANEIQLTCHTRLGTTSSSNCFI